MNEQGPNTDFIEDSHSSTNSVDEQSSAESSIPLRFVNGETSEEKARNLCWDATSGEVIWSFSPLDPSRGDFGTLGISGLRIEHRWFAEKSAKLGCLGSWRVENCFELIPGFWRENEPSTLGQHSLGVCCSAIE